MTPFITFHHFFLVCFVELTFNLYSQGSNVLSWHGGALFVCCALNTPHRRHCGNVKWKRWESWIKTRKYFQQQYGLCTTILPYCRHTYSQNEVNEQQTAFDAIKIELRNSFKETKTPTKPHLKWHYRQRANMPSLLRKTHCYWQVCWKIVPNNWDEIEWNKHIKNYQRISCRSKNYFLQLFSQLHHRLHA